jgi:hypothetical protein
VARSTPRAGCLEDRAGPRRRGRGHIPKLESLAAQVGDEVLCDALIRIASHPHHLEADREIEISTKRISDLVRAIKEYSYMDQAAMQEVDLHQGLENTLTILHYRLKGGIT